jgi:membrane-associated protein
MLRNPDSRILKREYLTMTEQFFAKHGGKAIVLCRFVPIVRTFGPFTAGVGRMNYARFQMFNVVGALLWVVPFVAAGCIFGNVPIVKENFSLVVMAIVLLSISPAFYHWFKTRAARRRARNQAETTPGTEDAVVAGTGGSALGE